ncbi:MAG: tetratricopeptide repeat protein [Flavobacteriales bacterium]|nr:tetratricopeptide repeat protein [Flavobacteriales bacterium]
MRKLLTILILCSPLLILAQGNEEELATYYYQNGEYEKALLYLEDIYKKKPNDTYFQYYLKSLTETDRMDDAQDLVEKHLKKNRTRLDLYVELGSMLETSGRPDKAKDNYDKAIKELGPGRAQAKKLADAFVRKNKAEYALSTYEKAKRQATDNYPYSYEIASLYGTIGDHEKMIDEYMNLIGYNKGYLRTVQNNLNRTFDFESDDPRVDMLKGSLLKKTQSTTDPIYYEMLIWLFTQRKEFNAAFVQAKAMDKRLQEDGKRMVALGSLCSNNEAYDVAAKCYRYIVDEKGPGTRYYETAKSLELVSAKKALTYDLLPPLEEVKALEGRFSEAISELGPGPESARLLSEQAELNAYYIHDGEKAIVLLDSAMRSPGISQEFRASIKLQLGDALLTQGYIWDASLYYSQVEKDFKEDALGAEAKFRNARVSYYAGDFEWAQGQLDVLKASTSKLISNDAMDLSLLITDNYNLDTIQRPMELYAMADLLTFQNRLDEAVTTLDSINAEYPFHSLDDEIIYLRADIAKKKGDFIQADSMYQEIGAMYFDDILADNALYERAELQERVFKDTDEAMELYKQLFIEYPNSLYAAEARKRFRFLRGDDLEDFEQKEEVIE